MTDVTAAAGRGPDTRAVRSYTRWGLVASALLLCLPAVNAALEDTWSPVVGIVLAVLVLGVAGAHVATSRRALDGAAPLLPAVAAVAVAVGVLAVVAGTAPGGLLPWLLPAGVGLSALVMARGWRRRDAPAVAVVVLGMGILLTVLGVPPQLPAAVRPLAGLVLVVPLVLDASQFWLWRVVLRLESARAMAAELSATRERARIAAELHDVQGHSLHVIAMRAELVERLVLTDPVAAHEHARTVRELAAAALAETRSLVHGYRVGDVAAELRNAAEVLRAAGATVAVHGDPAVVPAGAADVFAPLVREATTNVLRHSTPGEVTIRVERDAALVRLSVTNDGVHASVPDEAGGTGLTGLRARFAQRGGTVQAGHGGPDRWTLTGSLPVGAEQGE